MVEVDRPAPVPGGRYLYEEPCRTRYAATNALGPVQHFCSCGMAAISRCHRCASYACDGHSSVFNTPDGAVALCGPCSREENARREAERLAPTIAELQRVAALPRGGVAELLDLFHQRGVVKEGVTHQFGELTNREVAQFLQKVFGPRPLWLIPYPEAPAFGEAHGRDLFLDADGTQRRIHDGGVQGGAGPGGDGYRHYEAVNEVLGAPEELFQEQHWHDPDFPANINGLWYHYVPVEPLVEQARQGPMYAEFEWRQQRKGRELGRSRGWTAAVGVLVFAAGVTMGVVWILHGAVVAALLAFVVAVATLWPVSAAIYPEPEPHPADERLPWSPGG